MTASLWIVVEDNSEDDPDARLTWWSVDHYEDKENAVLAAEQLGDVIYHQPGYKPERLDD